ncbi:hypothetical protein VTK26DRAFT_3873 [Humicola hyalothermophila]
MVGKLPTEVVLIISVILGIPRLERDGWSDIPGLVSEIDYLHQLGVDVVWLSPMFESPQKDMGYDISDYQAAYPQYGTLEDVDRLIEACHNRGMKLILDLVANHTSDQHPLFQESRSSKTNPKRDWYIWKPPRCDEAGNRMPPTNWRGYFSTWTWDEQTQEYDGYRDLNAASQPRDPDSVLNFYRKALRLRKQYHDLFIHGAFRLLDAEDECLFVYVKESEVSRVGPGSQGPKRKALIVMNFTSHVQKCPDITAALGCKDGEQRLLQSPDLIPAFPQTDIIRTAVSWPSTFS